MYTYVRKLKGMSGRIWEQKPEVPGLEMEGNISEVLL